MTLFEPAANLYQQALARPAVERASNAQVQLRLAQSEGELAWLIYIIGQVRLAGMARGLCALLTCPMRTSADTCHRCSART